LPNIGINIICLVKDGILRLFESAIFHQKGHEMEHLKVVIIGAGMGGLATGIALKQAGYEVEIYDRVSELRAAGAAISLWSNGVKVLNWMGLGTALAKVGGQMERMAYYSHTGEKLTDFSLDPLVERVGQQPYPVARTDLWRRPSFSGCQVCEYSANPRSGNGELCRRTYCNGRFSDWSRWHPFHHSGVCCAKACPASVFWLRELEWTH
jgi:NAD(P)-binding Rossmann-like domain